MNPLPRRGFLKTVLATAAGASPSYGRFANAFSSATASEQSSSAASFFENGGQQLRFAPVGLPFAFQNFLRIENEWRSATLLGNPLLIGSSFPLVISRVRNESERIVFEGTAGAIGINGKRLQYNWNSEVSSVAASTSSC